MLSKPGALFDVLVHLRKIDFGTTALLLQDYPNPHKNELVGDWPAMGKLQYLTSLDLTGNRVTGFPEGLDLNFTRQMTAKETPVICGSVTTEITPCLFPIPQTNIFRRPLG